MTQREENPYRFTDSNKRYQTYDYYMRHRFGGKCAKIPIDAGFSCPNKDGTRGSGGCIFCRGGSGAATVCGLGISEQYERARRTVDAKWQPIGYIPYLQANTNTYAPLERLREIYRTAAALPGAVMLDIATRADCLDDGVLCELRRISETIPLTVELGLQSSSDATAAVIGRGHTFSEFVRGFERLRSVGGDIRICVHLINGLPGEGRDDMLRSASDVADLGVDDVKLHSLCVLEDTPLYDMWRKGEYEPIERDDYVSIVCDQLEILPESAVIGRITGDAPSDILAAPQWSRRKTEVANMVDKELYRRGTYQGCKTKK